MKPSDSSRKKYWTLEGDDAADKKLQANNNWDAKSSIEFHLDTFNKLNVHSGPYSYCLNKNSGPLKTGLTFILCIYDLFHLIKLHHTVINVFTYLKGRYFRGKKFSRKIFSRNLFSRNLFS